MPNAEEMKQKCLNRVSRMEDTRHLKQLLNCRLITERIVDLFLNEVLDER